jgi:hypothetical protein
MIEESLNKLIRGTGLDLQAYLHEVCSSQDILKTKVINHCYNVQLDGNGRHRVNDFIEFIATKVVEYSIPRSQFEKAKQHLIQHNTNTEFDKLRRKAEALFTDLSTTGEGGEILLYVLVQEFLKIPQLFCKMPLKTNPAMHYHGVDGIHAEFDATENVLALYWGESKLYKSLEEGIKACFLSLKEYLINPNSSQAPQERDLQLVKDNLDLNDEKLEDAIAEYFDKDNPNFNRLQYRGVCLIGFDYDKYPTLPNQINGNDFNKLVKKEISSWHASLQSGVLSHSTLDTFIIHVFFVPFPSVQKFREYFLQSIHITPRPVNKKPKATAAKKATTKRSRP